MTTLQSSHAATALREAVAACRVCEAHLVAGPRPIVQFSPTARILIIGQAPGSKVHASGVPWDDDSGNRLRDWLGIEPVVFYDSAKLALMPMGFCYPGKGPSGDLPPRLECAPLWHDRILAMLPADRLTVLVGSYAQARYLDDGGRSMVDRVRAGLEGLGGVIALPHPSWRVVGWMKRHPWFNDALLPKLRQAVAMQLGAHPL